MQPVHNGPSSRQPATAAARCTYTARACKLTFEQGNAIILPQHKCVCNRVHVGSLCDAARLPAPLRLLRPGTGSLDVPCNSELLCLTCSGSKVRPACQDAADAMLASHLQPLVAVLS